MVREQGHLRSADGRLALRPGDDLGRDLGQGEPSAEGPVIRVAGGSARVELSPSVGYIIFWNEPLVPSTFYNDFNEYYASIFADTAVAESLPFPRAVACGRPTKLGSVECANSQFP